MRWKEPLIKTQLELEPKMGQVAEQHCREGRLLAFYMVICYKCIGQLLSFPSCQGRCCYDLAWAFCALISTCLCKASVLEFKQPFWSRSVLQDHYGVVGVLLGHLMLLFSQGRK